MVGVMKVRRVCRGTRAWSDVSVNIQLGCSHGCRYCYARHNAIRRGYVKTPLEWEQQSRGHRNLALEQKHHAGVVMFPTRHDITPENLADCMMALRNLINVGDNKVLIVTKPRVECVERLVECFESHKEQIVFRFTIGCANSDILKIWEPHAPSFAERFTCLKLAHTRSFQTSVSMEPMLNTSAIEQDVSMLLPFVTESIWLGKMNAIGTRVLCDVPVAEVSRIRVGQARSRILEIYDSLKSNPLIKWKDSIRSVVELKDDKHLF